MADILLGSPDADLTRALEQFLAARGHLVVVANTSAQLIRRFWVIRPSVVVVDLAWPETENRHLCEYLSTEPSARLVPVAYLVWHETRSDHAPWQSKDIVLSKPLDGARLEAAVNELVGRGVPLEHAPAPPSSVLIYGPMKLDPSTYRVVVGDVAVPTTPTEFAILRELMRRAGEVVPIEDMLETVWGYAPGLGSPELVRVHIKNLRSKLAETIGSDFNPIRTVPRHGYLIPGDIASWRA